MELPTAIRAVQQAPKPFAKFALSRIGQIGISEDSLCRWLGKGKIVPDCSIWRGVEFLTAWLCAGYSHYREPSGWKYLTKSSVFCYEMVSLGHLLAAFIAMCFFLMACRITRRRASQISTMFIILRTFPFGIYADFPRRFLRESKIELCFSIICHRVGFYWTILQKHL